MRIGSGNLKIVRANRLGNLTFPINSFLIKTEIRHCPQKILGVGVTVIGGSFCGMRQHQGIGLRHIKRL